MADFLTAYKLLMKNEGGYTTDPNETYKGIDRKHNPVFKGWKLIDAAKWGGFEAEKHTREAWKKMDAALAGNTDLQKQVMEFYYLNYWKPVKGDLITDQSTANIVFDFAVNAGVKRAIMLTQLAIGVKADGDFGPVTLGQLNIMEPEYFSAFMVVQKSAHYIRCCDANKDNRRFLYAWIKRALEVA